MLFYCRFIALALCTFILAACGGSNEPSHPVFAAGTTVVTNTVSFSGPRNNYSITRTAAGYIVKDNIGADGTTTLATQNGVEALRFSDVTVNLGIGDKSKTLASADLKMLTELYIAFFNRVPDADGLSYWIDQFTGGQSIDDIALSFYAAAVQYTSLTGYSSAMSNAEFVKVIYKNVLGRSGATAPPDADVQHWANELANGHETKGSLIRTMLVSAHSFTNDPTWGWVPQLLDNKAIVANYFTVQQGLNYATPEDSIVRTMAISAAVTPFDTATAILLIGMADTAFNLAMPANVPTSAGAYSGTYGGYDNGTFSVTIDDNGIVSGMVHSNYDGGNYNVTGAVGSNGSISMSTAGTAGSAVFTGSIDVNTGVINGDWHYFGSAYGGTFSGHR
ncbi:MAG TPA: DUF4214 domain-containing protein [Paucimonas sp.]|nr:DUF4214 domain-containing protein [Paucimonas sp.]